MNFDREPLAIRTAVVAAIAAVVHVLVLLGVIDLDQGAEAALITAIDLIAAALIIVLVRPKVTPVSDPALTAGQLPGLTVLDKAGQPLPYTVTSHGQDIPSVRTPGTPVFDGWTSVEDKAPAADPIDPGKTPEYDQGGGLPAPVPASEVDQTPPPADWKKEH